MVSMVKHFVVPESLLRELNMFHDDLLARLQKEPLDEDERLETIELQEAVLNLLARVRVIVA